MQVRSNSIRAVAIALSLLAPVVGHEGIKLTPYYDPVGIKTVCVGHTGKDIENRKYTIDECKKIATKDLIIAIEQVQKRYPDAPDRVVFAMSDMVFNLGIGRLTNNTTIDKLLLAKKWDEACYQMPRWVYGNVGGVNMKLNGLVKRREWDKDVCLGKIVL